MLFRNTDTCAHISLCINTRRHLGIHLGIIGNIFSVKSIRDLSVFLLFDGQHRIRFRLRICAFELGAIKSTSGLKILMKLTIVIPKGNRPSRAVAMDRCASLGFYQQHQARGTNITSRTTHNGLQSAFETYVVETLMRVR